jgi:hypothetical protein
LALLEAVDAALSVDDPLLAAEKWMADGTDLGLQLLLSRAGDKGIAAKAMHDGIVVVRRVYGGFHGHHILSAI